MSVLTGALQAALRSSEQQGRSLEAMRIGQYIGKAAEAATSTEVRTALVLLRAEIARGAYR